MTEQPESHDGQSAPAAADAHVPALASPEPATSWTPPGAPVSEAASAPAAGAAEHPEIAVGASFAGGFLLALILKRLAR